MPTSISAYANGYTNLCTPPHVNTYQSSKAFAMKFATTRRNGQTEGIWPSVGS